MLIFPSFHFRMTSGSSEATTASGKVDVAEDENEIDISSELPDGDEERPEAEGANMDIPVVKKPRHD